MSEEKYHIMYLNPAQKASLRLIIYNYVTLRIKGSIDDIADGQVSSAEAVNQILDDLDYYESITGKMPHINYLSEYKGEVLMFVPKAFTFVREAILGYDPNHTLLTENQVRLIDIEYHYIRLVSDESSLHQYTKNEIRSYK